MSYWDLSQAFRKRSTRRVPFQVKRIKQFTITWSMSPRALKHGRLMPSRMESAELLRLSNSLSLKLKVSEIQAIGKVCLSSKADLVLERCLLILFKQSLFMIFLEKFFSCFNKVMTSCPIFLCQWSKFCSLKLWLSLYHARDC